MNLFKKKSSPTLHVNWDDRFEKQLNMDQPTESAIPCPWYVLMSALVQEYSLQNCS